MGSYLIPGAVSVQEAADYLGPPALSATWQHVEGGILFTDTALTDPECAALYAGYVPTGTTDQEYQAPRPPDVQAAIDHLQAFYQANPATVTGAQSAALHRSEVIVLRWLNRSLVEIEP